MTFLLKAVCLALIAAVLAATTAEAALTCSTVDSNVSPCIAYILGPATMPPTPCCTGVKNLNAAASTSADRQMACSCLQQLASSLYATVTPTALAKAAGLPGQCKVNIPYKISPSTDCKTVK